MLGRSHPLVRRLRALRRDGEMRRRDSVFLAEGLHLAAEALDCDAEIELAVAAAGWIESVEGQRLRARFDARRIEWHAVDDGVHASLQDARSPQPLTLVVRRVTVQLATALDPTRGPALVVLVAGVQDPGNLGTMLRSAEALGATAFVASRGADPYHPRAVRASAGAIFRLPPCVDELERALDALTLGAIQRVGSDARNGVLPEALDLARPTAICFGGEGAGLHPAVLSTLDAIVTIPMKPPSESLSVGAAAAILLYEAARQRRPSHFMRSAADRHPSAG